MPHIRANVVDQIVRPEEGGALYDPANLRAACRSCNMRRHDAAYFREKADGVANPWRSPYAHGQPSPPAPILTPPANQPGRPSTSDPRRFLEYAMSLHGVEAEPAEHRHARWAARVTVTAAGATFAICPASCPRPVRWYAPVRGIRRHRTTLR